MKYARIITVTLLTFSSCQHPPVDNKSNGSHVHQAIMQHQMLPLFKQYRYIMARDPGLYWLQCDGPDSVFVSYAVGKSSDEQLQALRDTLINRRRADLALVADSIWRDAREVGAFMFENAIRHLWYKSNSRPDSPQVMLFVIWSDDPDANNKMEDLLFFVDSAVPRPDTTIISDLDNSTTICRKLDSKWLSVIRRPNKRLHLTEDSLVGK